MVVVRESCCCHWRGAPVSVWACLYCGLVGGVGEGGDEGKIVVLLV